MDPRIKKAYWQVTALLLAAHFAGWAGTLALAMALTLLQAGHFTWYRRSMLAFEVQVRVAYLMLLWAGTVPGCWPVHVIQFIGVNALMITDYCLLARLLALAPWNRRAPFTRGLVLRVLLSPPVRGSILDAVNDSAPAGTGTPAAQGTMPR